MNKFTPFLRYINKTDFLPNNDFTVAYDCRMLYILNGSGVLHTEGSDFELKQDTFAYYPSGIKYFPKSSDDDKLSFITVNFDFDDLHEDVTDTLAPVPCDKFCREKEFPSYVCIEDNVFAKPFTIENSVFLKNYLLRLNDIFHNNSDYSKEISSTILKLCILEILKHKNNTVNNQLVDDIKNFIYQNFNKINSNSYISSEFKYHEYYLNSLFKKHTGTTIHKFIIDIRLKNSEELLSYSNRTIAEIASDCGFINANHFSRLFKEKKGISPLKFRNSSRNI